MEEKEAHKKSVKYERIELLIEINQLMEKPMLILAFVWLGLIIAEFFGSTDSVVLALDDIIWILFILDFFVSFIIAPDKADYLKQNWPIGLSIILPAFRLLRLAGIFKLARLAHLARSLTLLRLIATLKHGFRELRLILKKNGLGYILVLTVLLTFAGAVGLAIFESPEAVKHAGFNYVTGLTSYWDALWFTAMLMTTIGSQYWPVTTGGRILCFILGSYAFIFLGYVAGNIASHFIKPEDG